MHRRFEQAESVCPDSGALLTDGRQVPIVAEQRLVGSRLPQCDGPGQVQQHWVPRGSAILGSMGGTVW